jgi:hypothetical protein
MPHSLHFDADQIEYEDRRGAERRAVNGRR